MKKPVMIGTINACGTATLFDRQGRKVCTCLDTPNNIAAAFLLYPEADCAQSRFPNRVTTMREDYADRLTWISRDLPYHRPHILPA